MPGAAFPRLGVEALEGRAVPAAAAADLPVLPDLDPDDLAGSRAVAARGRALGRNPAAFMKVGDSNTERPGYLTPLGQAGYNPAVSGLATGYPELVDTWATYLAPVPGGNSFTRRSAAAGSGWSLDQVLPSLLAEVRATNPAVALVLVGSNDQVLYPDPGLYRARMAVLVDTLTAAGVVPVLSTLPRIPEAFGRDPTIRAFNRVVAELADEKDVPVVDLYRAQEALPLAGLGPDGIHFAASPRGGGLLLPADLQFGQNARNLLALRTLDQVRREVLAATPPVPPAPPTVPWRPVVPGQPVVAVGAAAGRPPAVRVADPATGAVAGQFLAYEPGFLGGVRVAVGDVDGDRVLDLVTAPGPGGGPVVKGFSGRTGRELFALMAYEPGFRGGVTVAVGDVDGDGRGEVVVGAGKGGGPRVRVFRADLSVAADFLAFDPGFRGGTEVAVGDFGGPVGRAVAVGAGDGGGPVVRLFDGRTGAPTAAVEAFDPALRSGVYVAAGDLDRDGRDELVAGAGRGGGPAVRAVDPATGAVTRAFSAGDRADGVRVAVTRSGWVVAGAAAGRGDPVRLFDADGTPVGPVFPLDEVLVPGVHIGG